MSSWPISFSKDAKPGKKRKREVAKSKEPKDYEESHKQRDFYQPWQDEFPWVVDTPGKGMTCTICTKYGSKSGDLPRHFLEGCTNYRKSALRFHSDSQYHKAAQKAKEDEDDDNNVFTKLATFLEEY